MKTFNNVVNFRCNVTKVTKLAKKHFKTKKLMRKNSKLCNELIRKEEKSYYDNINTLGIIESRKV